VKELVTLPREGNEFGFLETEMIRERNKVDSAIREATDTIDGYLSRRL
jgi:hypothetical protein